MARTRNGLMEGGGGEEDGDCGDALSQRGGAGGQAQEEEEEEEAAVVSAVSVDVGDAVAEEGSSMPEGSVKPSSCIRASCSAFSCWASRTACRIPSRVCVRVGQGEC